MGNGEWGMGNREWGMGNGDKTKIPFVLPLLKNPPFLSTPYSPLPTFHSLLPTPQTTKDDKTSRQCYRRLFGDKFRGWKTGGV
jgi:hypothetical protein